MRWKVSIFIALIAAGLGPNYAVASDIPRLSPERYCDEVAQVSGGSAMIRNGCIDMEQDAYNKLKRAWGSLPAQTRRYCTEVAQVAGGSYSILSGCVEMEVEATGGRKTFKY